MDPKYGFAALEQMLFGLRASIETNIGGSDEPFLALVKTSKADFPVLITADFWVAAWEDDEADFKGYERFTLISGDIGDPEQDPDGTNMFMPVAEKEWEYDSGEAGEDEAEIGWVALVWNVGGQWRVAAATPIPAMMMDADGKKIKAALKLRAYSPQFPLP